MSVKCLFYSRYFPPPLKGGSFVYCYYLLSKCTGSDIVVCTQAKDPVKETEFDRGALYQTVRNKLIVSESRVQTLIYYAVLLPMLVMWILRYRVSVLHLGMMNPDIVHGWIAARITGRPIIVNIYAEELTTGDNRSKGNPFRWLWWLHNRFSFGVLKRCDCIIAASQFTKQVLLRLGVREERICVITPGTDTRKSIALNRVQPEIMSLALGRRVLLTVGRLVPRKGQDMVLRALPQIVAQFPDLLYVIAGGARGPAKENYRKMVQDQGLQNNVVILDNPSGESITALYAACEIFIMANRTMPDGDTEGYGIVFLEAGAWGKPVIGGRAGGVVEAVDDGVTGILVDGASVDDIARAIERLLTDATLAHRMGEAGKIKFQKNGWDQKSEQYLGLIERVAGGGN